MAYRSLRRSVQWISSNTPLKAKENYSMKSLSIIVCAASVFVLSMAAAALAAEPEDVVLSFFEASKDGDVATMAALTSGKYYDRIKVLLTQNRQYSRYLREIHRGVTMEIVSREVSNGTAAVTARKLFPDGAFRDSNLVLEQNESGAWKITDEIME
jgi:hypothetical protein